MPYDIVKSLREDAAIFGNMPLTARVDMHPEFMRHMAELWLAAADEIDRLRASGCARDQSTTQFCAEAVRLERELAEARQIIYRLQNNAACCRTSPLATTRDGEEPFIPEAL